MIPDVIRIEPASACNLKCIYCPTGVSSGNRGVMSRETFDVIYGNLKDGVPRVAVMYHGGEPLLCKYLWDWIRRLKALGVGFIKIVTNGTLLTPVAIQWAMDSGLDLLEVSIDGQSPEESNTMRLGCDTYEVVENIRGLLDYRDKLGSKLPEVRIFSVQPKADAEFPPQFLLGAFGDRVTYEQTPILSWGTLETGIPPEKVVDGHCPLLDETMTIRWNGDVVPCCYDITSKHVLGNVHESSLEEIWSGELYERVRAGLNGAEPMDLCKGCMNIVK